MALEYCTVSNRHQKNVGSKGRRSSLRPGAADSHPHQGKLATMPDDHPADIAFLCPQRHSD